VSDRRSGESYAAVMKFGTRDPHPGGGVITKVCRKSNVQKSYNLKKNAINKKT